MKIIEQGISKLSESELGAIIGAGCSGNACGLQSCDANNCTGRVCGINACGANAFPVPPCGILAIYVNSPQQNLNL
jgi:hypothetical protein